MFAQSLSPESMTSTECWTNLKDTAREHLSLIEQYKSRVSSAGDQELKDEFLLHNKVFSSFLLYGHKMVTTNEFSDEDLASTLVCIASALADIYRMLSLQRMAQTTIAIAQAIMASPSSCDLRSQASHHLAHAKFLIEDRSVTAAVPHVIRALYFSHTIQDKNLLAGSLLVLVHLRNSYSVSVDELTSQFLTLSLGPLTITQFFSLPLLAVLDHAISLDPSYPIHTDLMHAKALHLAPDSPEAAQTVLLTAISNCRNHNDNTGRGMLLTTLARYLNDKNAKASVLAEAAEALEGTGVPCGNARRSLGECHLDIARDGFDFHPMRSPRPNPALPPLSQIHRFSPRPVPPQVFESVCLHLDLAEHHLQLSKQIFERCNKRHGQGVVLMLIGDVHVTRYSFFHITEMEGPSLRLKIRDLAIESYVQSRRLFEVHTAQGQRMLLRNNLSLLRALDLCREDPSGVTVSVPIDTEEICRESRHVCAMLPEADRDKFSALLNRVGA